MPTTTLVCHGEIEYLIYYSHDTAWPLVASRIDTSYNPLAPLDSNPRYNFITSDMTRSQRNQLWDTETNGISSYGEGDEGQLSGIEIEFERFMVTVFGRRRPMGYHSIFFTRILARFSNSI